MDTIFICLGVGTIDSERRISLSRCESHLIDRSIERHTFHDDLADDEKSKLREVLESLITQIEEGI